MTLSPRPNETALFAFIVPTLNIPIEIPVTVRTGADYGLRFTVSDITQLTPLASAKLTFWGFPAEASHNAQRFSKGSPGKPAGLRGPHRHQLHSRRLPARVCPSSRSPTTRPPARASR